MNHEGLEIKNRLPGVKNQVCKQENLNKKHHQVQDLGLTFRDKVSESAPILLDFIQYALPKDAGLGEKALPLIASMIKKIMLGLVEG